MSVADIKNWETNKLPMVMLWPVEGFNFGYQVNRVKNGDNIIPSFRLPQCEIAGSMELGGAANNKDLVKQIDTIISNDDWNYFNVNNLPVCLRTNNIIDVFLAPYYKKPTIVESISASPNVWKNIPTGLKQTVVTDVLGPQSNWTYEGDKWGSSLFMQTFMKKVPSPAYVLLRENNESPEQEINEAYTVFPNPKQYNLDGTTKLTWELDASLRNADIRLADYLLVNPTLTPDNIMLLFAQKRAELYNILLTAFKNKLTPVYQKLKTVAYGVLSFSGFPQNNIPVGYAPELLSYDAGSLRVYNQGGVDFTALIQTNFLHAIPGWESSESRNPKAWREISVFIEENAIWKGFQNGFHKVITPSMYEGYLQNLMWMLHDKGTPFAITHYNNYNTKPTQKMFTDTRATTLGFPELANLTVEDYFNSLVNASNKIANNSILRDFWQNGETVIVPGIHPQDKINQNTIDKEDIKQIPYKLSINTKYVTDRPDTRWRVLECDVNKPQSKWNFYLPPQQIPLANLADVKDKIKVWGTAKKKGDEYLVCLWSPCDLTTQVTFTLPGIGDFTVDAPNNLDYYVISRDSVDFPCLTDIKNYLTDKGEATTLVDSLQVKLDSYAGYTAKKVTL